MTTATETFHHDIADRHDKVLIVDFGSQVTQLIARRVRERSRKAVILSGGPAR